MTSPVLRKLRDWLTIDEAASELSVAIAETVSPAEVLRLAIDEHLRLALYLPGRVMAECQRLDDEAIDPPSQRMPIEGLCDLPMYGRGKRQIEHDYLWMLGTYLPMNSPAGALVEQGEWLCTLPPDKGASGLSSRASSEFPQGSVLAVRRTAIEEFIASTLGLSKASPKDDVSHVPDAQLGTRERTTLLTIIAALANEAGIDVSKATKAGVTVSNLIAAMGYQVAPNTISRHLRILTDTLPSRLPDTAPPKKDEER